MSTSNRILEARARAGLSQSQLAARAGVPQPNLSAYEAGRVQPRPETLARILAATIERPSVVLRRDRERVLELAGRRRAGNVRGLRQHRPGRGCRRQRRRPPRHLRARGLDPRCSGPGA